jgi:multimeric flavodoxin WrbA
MGAKLRQRACVEREFNLCDEKIAFCTGCFGCWIKTPGECVINDAGRAITREFIESDLAVFLTPVTFGGYSAELKKALDRLIPILSPFFITIDGESHHKKRYKHYPRLAVIGLLPAADAEAATVFQTLVSRNAINMHTPAFAVETFIDGSEEAAISSKLDSVLNQIGLAL